MSKRLMRFSGLVWLTACLTFMSGQVVQGEVIGNSLDDFSGTQGENGWFYGYRNVTLDGKGINYDPNVDFLPFDGSMYDGSKWDLDTAGAAPWTEVAQEAIHPNGSNNGEQHWAIRRYVPSELSAATTVAVTWHARKQNTGGGNGVTGALHVNGVRVQSAVIAFGDSAGVTNVYYMNARPTDMLDIILSPVGSNGSDEDGSDGSYTWMKIETVPDTDSDGLPDPWENLYFPGDLTKLSAAGDADGDGMTDTAELAKSTHPNNADTDNDGLKDGVETNTGTFVSASNTGTDPLKADTDGDGRKDGDEILVAPLTNPFDTDSDDDNYLDGDEVATGHNPNDAADNVEATAIANSASGFSGVQGQNGWYHGYRNYTADGGGDDYNADTGFIAFKGGDGMGDWDGETQQWSGNQWDLNTAAAAPWTELGTENTHPNGPSPVHWTVRRWVASDLTKVTPLALRWHVRKTNLGCGNGVTGGLYINGQLKDKAVVLPGDGTGVTHTFFANVAPGDKIDITLSPQGTDGGFADGCDGSISRLLVDPTLPANPIQPDGTVFVPVGAGDSDGDTLPDVWEKLYFPNDLTKLTASGDYDQDGLNDTGEYQRDSDPTKPDTDGDGLTDKVETGTGTFVSPNDTGSNPKKADTDGDGLSDAAEVQGTPATNPNKVDSDSDQFSDPEELAAGTDPNNAAENPLTYVIANSEKEFSGTQGKDGWYNGYRNYDPVAAVVDYDPNADFIPFPGGEGQGDWDGVAQTWNNGSWDLETAAQAPWTYQTALSVHPNGANSAPDTGLESWVTRRWVASELAKATPVALIWTVKKENLANEGVTGVLFVNGKRVDSATIAGNDGKGQTRRFYVNLKPTDIVDLALSPEGVNADRNDWSDGSITLLWVDTKIPPNPTQPDGTPFVPGGQIKVSGAYAYATGTFTLTWPSEAGAKYSVHVSTDLKTWTPLKTGLDSGGATTSYVEVLMPQPAARFYKVSTP